jgi:hypothetical protein
MPQRSVALIAKLTDLAYSVQRCSSGCGHKGCGGVYRWLQTEVQALQEFLL